MQSASAENYSKIQNKQGNDGLGKLWTRSSRYWATCQSDAGLARRSTVLDSVMDSRYRDAGLEKTQEQHPLQGAKIHNKDFAAWSVKLKEKTTYLYMYIYIYYS